MPVDENELLDAARRIHPADQELRICWELVVRGIEHSWLDAFEVHDVVSHLRTRRDITIDELGFQWVDGRLRVTYRGREAWCCPEAILEPLSTLLSERPLRAEDFTTRRIAWGYTGDDAIPYRASVDWAELTIRLNAGQAAPPYTLIVDGHEPLDLHDWPRIWERPPTPIHLDADLVRAWSEQLCRLVVDDPTRAAAALGLPGEIVRRREDATVEPPPPGAREVLFDVRGGYLDNVRVQLATAAMTRADLDLRLGSGIPLPRVHGDRRHKITYRVEVYGAPYVCSVCVSFAAEPNATSTATEVVIRRAAAPAQPGR